MMVSALIAHGHGHSDPCTQLRVPYLNTVRRYTLLITVSCLTACIAEAVEVQTIQPDSFGLSALKELPDRRQITLQTTLYNSPMDLRDQ